jgi:hypothetical protein
VLLGDAVSLAYIRVLLREASMDETRNQRQGAYRQSPFGIVAAFLCEVATSAFERFGRIDLDLSLRC